MSTRSCRPCASRSSLNTSSAPRCRHEPRGCPGARSLMQTNRYRSGMAMDDLLRAGAAAFRRGVGPDELRTVRGRAVVERRARQPQHRGDVDVQPDAVVLDLDLAV